MLSEVEEDEPTGFIRLDKFQPMMGRVLKSKSLAGCTGYGYVPLRGHTSISEADPQGDFPMPRPHSLEWDTPLYCDSSGTSQPHILSRGT